MKAFHLGAFEVMVVTDDRLSESGGDGGGAFMRFCVCACAQFFFFSRRSFWSTERPIDGAAAFMEPGPAEGGCGGGTKRSGGGSCLIR